MHEVSAQAEPDQHARLTEAPAKIIWGEPTKDVVKWLREGGLDPPPTV